MMAKKALVVNPKPNNRRAVSLAFAGTLLAVSLGSAIFTGESPTFVQQQSGYCIGPNGCQSHTEWVRSEPTNDISLLRVFRGILCVTTLISGLIIIAIEFDDWRSI